MRLAAAWLWLAACASSSIQSDVERVRALSGAAALPAVPEAIEPLTADEVHALLRQPLDADAAVRIALLNNRELRAELRDMGIERGELMQAGTIANPVFEAEILPERNSTVALRVEYDLSSLVLAPVRANAASHDLEAARFRSAGAVVETGFLVRAAFYALQAADARLELARTTLEAFAAARDAASALRKSGNTRALDLAIETAAYERARVTISELELAASDARERMQQLLGLHGEDCAWTAAGTLADAPAEIESHERLEARAVEGSLDLRETRSRLEALARKAGYSQLRGWLPDIVLDVHALVGDPDATVPPPALRFGGGLSLSLPIFDQQRGTTRSLEAQRDALVERYYGLAIRLRSNVREARNHLRSAHHRARHYRETIVPAQAKVTEQTLLQYNGMQLGVFALLHARREQLEVELARVETLREYWTARAALDALLAGRRIGEGK